MKHVFTNRDYAAWSSEHSCEFEAVGDALLLHGNALDILPLFSDMIDCIVTDPPYKLTSGGDGEGDGRMSGKFHTSNYQNGGDIVTCDIDWPDFMPLIARSMAVQSHAYIMANNRNVQPMLNAAEAAGLRFHNLLVWDKGTATPNRWYMKNCEYTGFFFKGVARQINDCGAKQLLHVPQEAYGDHPTTKPVMLMRHYIEQSTQPGGLILDPFMGSGSTGAAALKAGRRFVGIELERKYFDLAVRRMREALAGDEQKSMF